jgi:hypothetical protein
MFGKLFGKGSGDKDEPPPPSGGVLESDDPRIAQGHERLRTWWDTIGPSDPDVITYILNPQFQGAPGWPNMRQAFRVVRPPGSLIIASDGLSDPFVGTDMTDRQGFGCEVYIEAPELAGADFTAIRDSWAFPAIEMFAQNVANLGGISQQIARHGVLSMELPCADAMPAGWAAESGMVGALIGVTHPARPTRIADMPFGPVDVIALTLIRPAQLRDVMGGGAAARQSLAVSLGGPATRLGIARDS